LTPCPAAPTPPAGRAPLTAATSSWWLALLLTGWLLAGAPTPAFAWGDLGHKVVCEIAFQELNEKARQEVLRLIQLDQQFRLLGFAESCTWPDYPRRRTDEHVVYVPRDFTQFTAVQCPLADRCVLTAILKDVAVLRSSARAAARLAALKYLGHWVGDLHQPLHVAFEDDGGGVKINEDGPCPIHRKNLHNVWDRCILEHNLGTRVTDVVRTLTNEITDQERTRWRAAPIERWANESLDVMRQPALEYCVKVGDTCRYTADRPIYRNGDPQRAVDVNTAYLEAHRPTVGERLKQAGVRLGHLLNQALGQ